MNSKPNQDHPLRVGLVPSDVTVRLHFAGREKEIGMLKALYSQRKHVLIIGPSGIGKSALLDQLRLHSSLFLSKNSSNPSQIFDNLEEECKWPHSRLNLIKRKHRLLAYLEKRSEAVAFDHLSRTSVAVARFISAIMKNVPVWIICRSDRVQNIGSIWRFLANFVHLRIEPLKKTDSKMLIAQAVARGIVPPEAFSYVAPLYRVSKGNPRLLKTLLGTLASREYKTGMSLGRRLRFLEKDNLETHSTN